MHTVVAKAPLLQPGVIVISYTVWAVRRSKSYRVEVVVGEVTVFEDDDIEVALVFALSNAGDNDIVVINKELVINATEDIVATK